MGGGGGGGRKELGNERGTQLGWKERQKNTVCYMKAELWNSEMATFLLKIRLILP